MRHSPEFISLAALDVAQRLGQRLRRARKAQGRTLVELEQSCRVHRQTLARLERGDPGVSLGVLLTVLEALRELPDIELLLSQPEVPRHRRGAAPVPLERDF
jgi:transcriptional regulator with XRE-family HTH domain